MSSGASRSRVKLFFLLLLVIAAGLFSRSEHASSLPVFIQSYAGDTLWALTLFVFLAFVSSSAGTKELVMISLIIAFAVEFSQMYQAEWINSIRRTTPGGLILGFGFKWSDLVCYSAGIFICFLFDSLKRTPGSG